MKYPVITDTVEGMYEKEVTIKWSPVEGADKYSIIVENQETKEWKQIDFIDDTEYTLNDLPPAPYKLWVHAYFIQNKYLGTLKESIDKGMSVTNSQAIMKEAKYTSSPYFRVRVMLKADFRALIKDKAALAKMVPLGKLPQPPSLIEPENGAIVPKSQ